MIADALKFSVYLGESVAALCPPMEASVTLIVEEPAPASAGLSAQPPNRRKEGHQDLVPLSLRDRWKLLRILAAMP